MKTIALVMLSFISANLWAQQVNNFNLVNIQNDQKVSLDTYPSCEGLVIIFTTTACPYDDYYRNRIQNISQNYNTRVPVLLVNSSVDAADNTDGMKKKAKQLNLALPYLSDKDQALMASLDAKKSPEAFLLKNSNGKFSVVYRGAIDDNPQVEADVRQHYLRDAIDIMLTGKKIETPEVRPVGCNLKKKG